MSQFKNILVLFIFAASLISFNACSGPEGDYPGAEYMPDMAHSVAYEANVYNYYYLNTWDSVSVKKLKELSMPRNPVTGTIPRGYAGSMAKGNATSVAFTPNGSVPYYYGSSEDERARAMNEIIDNPFPITTSGLARGKNLYDIYCGICHGDKGDGNGWLVDEKNKNAKYPAAPANFLLDTFYNSTNGRYLHAIMYGKGLMGDYKDKISYEERWQVIHYIHSLQAKEKGQEYSEERNTYSSVSADVPGATIEKVIHNMAPHEVYESHEHPEGDGDGSETHGHDTEGGDDHEH